MKEILERTLFLDNVDIFKELSLDELGQIAQISELGNYQEDEILFRQGDPGNYAYIIVNGGVELYLESGKKHQSLMLLPAGECFGEMALLDGQNRSASARITKESTLLRISREDLIRVMKRYPSIALGIISQLSIRLRDGNLKYNILKETVTKLGEIYKKAAPIVGERIKGNNKENISERIGETS